MGWAHGIDKNGREVGYGVVDTCHHPECKREVDRGLGCRCGGVSNLHDDYGCGDFFCGKHLFFGKEDQLCPACFKAEQTQEDGDAGSSD